MTYKPLTHQQADEMMRPPLIDDGRYQFEVIEVHKSDKYHNPLVDKSGAPMTKLRLKIWDHNAHERPVFTNLFWGEENKMSYRTRHYAESVGALELYEKGDLLDRIQVTVGRTGVCEIYTQKGRDKNDGSGEKWPDKNEVRDFFVMENTAPVAKTDDKAKDDFSDDIPF
jgi:hypothetical protein